MAIVKLEVARAKRARVRGDAGEPRQLRQCGRWDRPLGRQQGRFPGHDVFRRRELETARGTEGLGGCPGRETCAATGGQAGRRGRGVGSVAGLPVSRPRRKPRR